MRWAAAMIIPVAVLAVACSGGSATVESNEPPSAEQPSPTEAAATSTSPATTELGPTTTPPPATTDVTATTEQPEEPEEPEAELNLDALEPGDRLLIISDFGRTLTRYTQVGDVDSWELPGIQRVHPTSADGHVLLDLADNRTGESSFDLFDLDDGNTLASLSQERASLHAGRSEPYARSIVYGRETIVIDPDSGEQMAAATFVVDLIDSGPGDVVLLASVDLAGPHLFLLPDGTTVEGDGCGGFLVDGFYSGCDDGTIRVHDTDGSVRETIAAVDGIWWPISTERWMRTDMAGVRWRYWSEDIWQQPFLATDPSEPGERVPFIVPPYGLCLTCTVREGFVPGTADRPSQILEIATTGTVLRIDERDTRYRPTEFLTPVRRPSQNGAWQLTYPPPSGGYESESIRVLRWRPELLDFEYETVDKPDDCDPGFPLSRYIFLSCDSTYRLTDGPALVPVEVPTGAEVRWGRMIDNDRALVRDRTDSLWILDVSTGDIELLGSSIDDDVEVIPGR